MGARNHGYPAPREKWDCVVKMVDAIRVHFAIFLLMRNSEQFPPAGRDVIVERRVVQLTGQRGCCNPERHIYDR